MHAFSLRPARSMGGVGGEGLRPALLKYTTFKRSPLFGPRRGPRISRRSFHAYRAMVRSVQYGAECTIPRRSGTMMRCLNDGLTEHPTAFASKGIQNRNVLMHINLAWTGATNGGAK